MCGQIEQVKECLAQYLFKDGPIEGKINDGRIDLAIEKQKKKQHLVSRPRNSLTFVASATESSSRSDDDTMSVHRAGGATKKSMPFRRHPSG